MIRRPPRSTQSRSSAASDVYKRQDTTLVLVGRNPAKIAEIGKRLGCEYYACDYARLGDVRALAATLARTHPVIDVLANNAGGVFSPRTVTGDGYETTFQVNHLAGLLRTEELLPSVRAVEGTIIFTSSMAAFQGAVDLTDLGKETVSYTHL